MEELISIPVKLFLQESSILDTKRLIIATDRRLFTLPLRSILNVVNFASGFAVDHMDER